MLQTVTVLNNPALIEGAPSLIEKPFSGLWLVFWAIALSIGWLLPNHYLPWSSFHTEAWVAVLALLAAWIVLLRTQGQVSVYASGAMVAIVALLPFFQVWAGLVTSEAVAAVNTIYLSGLLLTILIGSRWEVCSPLQLVDGLFLAICVACTVSVGLQLHQALNLQLLFIWDMGNFTGRPFANFGQPNLLATFLLWGLISVGWALARNRIGGWVALFLAAFFLLGIALTGSRTAWLGIVLINAAAWYWRKLAGRRPMHWPVLVLSLFFVVCLGVRGWFSVLLGDVGGPDIVRIATELRPQVWELFLDAVWQQPWFGYGWGQTVNAQLLVASRHAPIGSSYTHAHNLLLDSLLWMGVPIGLAAIALLAVWAWRRFSAITTMEDALLLLFLLILCNHAMLEFPYAYAYFLLPAGFVVGVLDVRLGARVIFTISRHVAVGLCLAVTLLFGAIARDYFLIEASYSALRFELANIKTNASAAAPSVLILTNLRDLITYVRFEPYAGMSPQELAWMRGVATQYPSSGIIHKYAAALAWDGQVEESQLWLVRLCKVVPPLECAAVRRQWIEHSKFDASWRAVKWPDSLPN